MRVIRTLAVLIATVTLTACLNSTTIVKVKPDGSGTVEQTTLVNTGAMIPMQPTQKIEKTAKNVIPSSFCALTRCATLMFRACSYE